VPCHKSIVGCSVGWDSGFPILFELKSAQLCSTMSNEGLQEKRDSAIHRRFPLILCDLC